MTLEDFFKEDPWESVNAPNYPDRAVRFYEKDSRMWAAMDADHRLVFFIQIEGKHKPENIDGLNGVSVSIERYENYSRFVLKLEEIELKNKFTMATKALAYNLSKETDQNIFTSAKKELKEWSGFLSPSRSGLGREELIGLWGELYILKNFMLALHPLTNAVRYWIGPRDKKQDFSMTNLAIETKTTMSGDDAVIKISSKEQLEKITEKLYLAQVFINEGNDEEGTSIQDFYNDLSQQMTTDLASQIEFEKKISRFMSKATENELNQKFIFLKLKIYDVNDNFPKITRAEIGDNAITTVRYSIESNQLGDFIIDRDITDIIQDG